MANIKAIGCSNIVVDPKHPKHVWAAMTQQAATPVFASVDGGAAWREGGQGIPDKTEVRGLHLDLTSAPGKRRLFAATNTGFYISSDNASTWTKETSLADEEFLAMTGCTAPATSGVLFAAAKGKGVYRYDIASAHWDFVGKGLPGDGVSCKLLAMPQNGNNIAYAVCGMGEIFRTDDSGTTWRRVHDAMKDPVADCWISAELGPGWAGNIQGIAVNPADPDEVVFTDFMRACRSQDGGQTWCSLYTRHSGDGWQSTGLDVTTTYRLLFDPKDPDHQYIACGDIGLLKSTDNGKSWRRAVKGVPQFWANTCYDICFDPVDAGRMWGAFSRLHDLPHHFGANSGGICISSDAAKTWTPCAGLPKLAGTSIVVDSRSDPGSRTLYAGFCQGGVYKSGDGGKTWTKKSNGLPDNPTVWRIALHRDGTLLCVVSRFRLASGGLYISTDGAETWNKLDIAGDATRVFDAVMDPRSSKTIYATFFAGDRDLGGGLFKSADGGRTWRRSLSDPQVWGVTLSPISPDVVYACCMATGSGPTRQVLRSSDGGKSWSRLSGLPFYNLHSVTVDPRDPQTICVTTFGGGVWKTTIPKTSVAREIGRTN
ncbi:MAG: hypothetical protein WCB27_05185 [Thermoguttaceae bacterium]